MSEITKISELQISQPFARLEVEIVSKEEPRSFATARGSGTVCNAAVKDDTGEIKLTLWNEQANQFSEGDNVVIENGWCSEFRGEKQISTGKQGTITKKE